MLGQRFETTTTPTHHINRFFIFVRGTTSKTPATKNTFKFWSTTSRQRHEKNHTSSCWGIAPRPRHRQQIVYLCAGALPDQDTGNKSNIFVLGQHLTMLDQDTSKKSYIVAGIHFETKTPATNRTSSCWGSTSRPRHRQQIVHLCPGAPLQDQDTSTTSKARHQQQIAYLSAGAPLRDHDTSNKSCISALGHNFKDTGNKT